MIYFKKTIKRGSYMKQCGGSTLFLDKTNITTEEIFSIPEGKTEKEVKIFDNLDLTGFEPKRDVPGKKVIVSRDNFGIGENQESVAKALKAAGILTIVVSTIGSEFKKILKNENIVVVDLDKKTIEDMFKTFSEKDTDCLVLLSEDGTSKIKLISGSLSKSYTFNLEEFYKKLFQEGGLTSCKNV